MSRVLVAAGALLVSVALAKAENHASFSPELKDSQPQTVAAEPAPATVAAAVADTPPAKRGKDAKRRTRVAASATIVDGKAAAKRAVASILMPPSRSAAGLGTAAPTSVVPGPVSAATPAETKAAEAQATYEPKAPATDAASAGKTEAAAPTPASAPAAIVGGPVEKSSETVATLLARHAEANGVPLKLAEAVVRIESRGNVRASNHGALGLMQIKYGTARAAGFGGAAVGLLVAETNLRYGMKILGRAYKAAGGDTCGALMRYQSGHFSTHMSSANRAYCSRARAIMAGV